MTSTPYPHSLNDHGNIREVFWDAEAETNWPRGLVVCRPCEADISALAQHLAAMQSHYHQPVSDAVAMKAATRLARRPTGDDFYPHTLIALAGDEPGGNILVGSLVMNVSFPATELTDSLNIRDLYVAETMRRHGVATAMMRAAARLTLELGFSALDWTADSKNGGALKMYKECGAAFIDRTCLRLIGKALHNAAGYSGTVAPLPG